MRLEEIIDAHELRNKIMERQDKLRHGAAKPRACYALIAKHRASMMHANTAK
jgi:hypothetical protein